MSILKSRVIAPTLLALSITGHVLAGDLSGRTLIYEKSNLDGSNAARIAVHHAKGHVIESFKWHHGADHATRVEAVIDSQSHTVHRFRAYAVASGGEAELRAELTAHGDGGFTVRLGESVQQVSLPARRWHSYDFDLASLAYAYRFIQDKHTTFEFSVFDLDLAVDPPEFRDFGPVSMTFETEEEYSGILSRRYRIDGPGLDHRGGQIWFDGASDDLAGFEIRKPDEPGYDSGRLRLLETLNLDEAGWADFQLKALNGSNP